MIYEWRCLKCGELRTKKSAIAYRDTPPTEKCSQDHYEWKRVITSAPSVPFIALRDKGIFMDEHGNYPPRKMD